MITKEEKLQDKCLYEIGDTTSGGAKIHGIHVKAMSFIVFVTPKGQLSWEVSKACPDISQAISNIKSIESLASAKLTKKRMKVVSGMLGTILSSLLSIVDYKYDASVFNDVDKFIEEYEDELQSTISSGPDFAIYRMKDDRIQWTHNKLTDPLRKAVEEFGALQSLARSTLSSSQRNSISTLLASSLSSAFRNKEISETTDYFDKARKFVHSQIENSLKIQIFYVSLFTTLAMQILLLIGYLIFNNGLMYFAGASAGVFGVMVSSLQRNNKTKMDPYSSQIGLYSEGISRIFIGVIFGIFIIFCAKSELALAPFKDDIYALVCFAFISGFSERFVPDLMSSVAGKVNGNS